MATKCHYYILKYAMYGPVFSFLLLLMVWPTATIPVTFCHNTERQIESILNLLQIIREKVTGASLKDQRENNPVLITDQCAVIQSVNSYQACDLDLSAEIPEITYMRVETKGLVENLQSFRDDCVLSPAVCPFSHLSMWTKTDVLLKLWSQDVAACKNVIQSMCSSPNYNFV